MKTIILVITSFLIITAAFIILKSSSNNDIQNIQLNQKQFEESYNKQMMEINKKQDEIITAYDLIISNRILHCKTNIE
jgi:ABC-type transporter lipoprotein component MlaA